MGQHVPGVVSKNGGLANDTWNVNAQMMEAYINDVATEKSDFDAFVSDVFNVKKSNRFGEKIGSVTTVGNFKPMTADGANAPAVDIISGPTKTIQHTTFKEQFRITREANEDAEIDMMQAKARGMVQAYKRTRAAFASKALTANAEAVSTQKTFTFEGVSGFDCSSADGKAIFAVDHPTVVDDSITQSNIFTNGFGTDAKMLNKLANIGRNFKNNSNIVMGYIFDTIIIPSNAPALEDIIKKIIRSELTVGSDYNDVNTQKGLWKLIIDPSWQVSAGAEPFILMSSQANKELLGNKFYDRVSLDVTAHVDQSTDDMIWNGYGRMSVGFPSWQHVIMGGAAHGTTLDPLSI